MKLELVMQELQELGTDQNVKVYKRHGAGEILFGVSFANLKKMKKKINLDHELAKKLWLTKNTDARVLATFIADPDEITIELANEWINEIHYYLLADMLAGLIARSKTNNVWHSIMYEWMDSSKEFVKQTGYSIFGSALKNKKNISNNECKELLVKIEEEIHDSPNRARYTMNNTVIAIGVFRPELENIAIETAKKIGKVEVDHGETSCKTPDAVSYIIKSNSRKKKKEKIKKIH